MLRLAAESDCIAINEIYNYFVLQSTCTYQTEPETIENRIAWFSHHGPAHPVIVAEIQGEIVGWGALSRFHSREAYARTVENAVYVHHQFHGRGIGKCILNDLCQRAAILNHHTVIALISADQPASLGLHASLGFEHAGSLKQVGYKFKRWLDVVYLQKIL